MTSTAALALASLLALPPLAPQDTRSPIEGVRFGMSLLVLGDRDGDGAPELAIGAPAARLGEERARPGVVLVLSGADRSVLQEWRGEPERHLFGHALVSAGDVDGDGHGDVIVGYERGARCEVRSGKSGARLHAFDRAWTDLLAFGDLDEDGADDLLLVDGVHVEVRSGRGGGLLHRAGLSTRVRRVMPAGDLDGDGLIDLVTDGEVKELWVSGRPAEGERLDLFDYGARRAFADLWPGVDWSAEAKLLTATPAGDLDRDDAPDLWVALERGTAGRVLALSLERRAPLAAIEGGASLGHALQVHGDLNGDGTTDVVVAQEVGPFVVELRAHSGSDGAELWHKSWGDGGMTVWPQLATLPPREPGGPARVLVSGCDYRWHGWVQRNGFLQAMAADTGEVLWRLEVDQVRPLGADAGAIYR